MSVQDTLEERDAQYGSYKEQLTCKVTIIEALQNLHHKKHGKHMRTGHLMCIVDIVTKLTRVGVDMNHIDSWHDIAGFATLTEEMLNADDNNT